MNKDKDMRKYYILALNRVSFLTPRERLSLINIFNDLSYVFHKLSKRDLESVLGRNIRSKLWNPEYILQLADNDFKELSSGRINCIFLGDKNYPAQLGEIYDPPIVLFCKGKMFDNNKETLGIVGTRQPTGNARKAAYMLGYDFAKLGMNIVSGLALGIDTEAHIGCLNADGITLAVLGCGVDIIYPAANRKIALQILNNNGMIISEFSPGTPPLKYNFPCRNRIISGLSHSVVVVQAPKRSGALITADYALEQGRELYVHSAGVNNNTSAGTKALAESGANIINTYEDVLANMECSLIYETEKDTRCKNVCGNTENNIAKKLAENMELELAGKTNRYIEENYI